MQLLLPFLNAKPDVGRFAATPVMGRSAMNNGLAQSHKLHADKRGLANGVASKMPDMAHADWQYKITGTCLPIWDL